MDNSRLKIGENIKKNRVIRGITQHELAEMIGLTEKQISKIETGVHYPKFENFVKILEALNLTMKDFELGSENTQSQTLKSVLKIVYTSSEEELKCFLSFFKNVEKLKRKTKDK